MSTSCRGDDNYCVRACVQPMHDTLCPALCTLHFALLAISPAPLFFTRAYWPTALRCFRLLNRYLPLNKRNPSRGEAGWSHRRAIFFRGTAFDAMHVCVVRRLGWLEDACTTVSMPQLCVTLLSSPVVLLGILTRVCLAPFEESFLTQVDGHVHE